MRFDYFYGRESDLFSFIRVPKLLFTEELFKGLSTEAKLLYGLLLDRVSLSNENGWADENKRIYINFSIQDVIDHLGCGSNKAVNTMKELEECGLIEKKRVGFTKPNIIYVKNFYSVFSKEEFMNVEKQNSGISESNNHECVKPQPNNTDINKPNQNNGMEGNGLDELVSYEGYVASNISLDILKQKYPYRQELLDQIVALIVDVLCSCSSKICVGKTDKPANVVKSQFMKLKYEHIEYVIDALQSNTTKVRNMRQYLITSLYNAPLTMDAHYEAEYRHDHANGKI